MKVCIIQPKYSTKFEESEQVYLEQTKILDACDESMDVIVCPEMWDIPALTKTKEQYEEAAHRYHERTMEKASEVAKRCNAILFINGVDFTEEGLANTIKPSTTKISVTLMTIDTIFLVFGFSMVTT